MHQWECEEVVTRFESFVCCSETKYCCRVEGESSISASIDQSQ